MSTSSKYSNNKISDILKNGTDHFIMRCYISTIFDFDFKKSEYHLFWFNKNRGIDEDSMRYKHLSSKKMGKKEILFFKSNSNLYVKKISSKDGDIWEHKDIGFNLDLVRITQLDLDFNQKP